MINRNLNAEILDLRKKLDAVQAQVEARNAARTEDGTSRLEAVATDEAERPAPRDGQPGHGDG